MGAACALATAGIFIDDSYAIMTWIALALSASGHILLFVTRDI